MYSFQTGTKRKKDKHTIQLLFVIIFLLIAGLIATAYSYKNARQSADQIHQALATRVIDESTKALENAYRLTQSTGTSTVTALSSLRGHIYAMQAFNTLASDVYGSGTYLVDPELLDSCIKTLNDCDSTRQSGGVMTSLYTSLKDQVQLIHSSVDR